MSISWHTKHKRQKETCNFVWVKTEILYCCLYRSGGMFSNPNSSLAQKYGCRITNEARNFISGSWWQKRQTARLTLQGTFPGLDQRWYVKTAHIYCCLGDKEVTREWCPIAERPTKRRFFFPRLLEKSSCPSSCIFYILIIWGTCCQGNYSQ